MFTFSLTGTIGCPLTGLGVVSAVIVLVAYNQYLLLRTFLTGLNQVDPAVMEAARGIGMRDFEILLRVQISLAKAALFAGIRLAVISTIGIGTIASGINAEGLGDLLFDASRYSTISACNSKVPFEIAI